MIVFLLFSFFQLNAAESGVDERSGPAGSQLVRRGMFCPADIRNNIRDWQQRQEALEAQMARECPVGMVGYFRRMFESGALIRDEQQQDDLIDTSPEVPELKESVDWKYVTEWRNGPGRERAFLTASFQCSHIESHSSCDITCWNLHLVSLAEELQKCEKEIREGRDTLDLNRFVRIATFVRNEKDYTLSGYVFLEKQVDKLRELMPKRKEDPVE